MRSPVVVGICGGIGSGKSAVSRAFERLGARVIDADRVAHEVLTEPLVVSAVRQRFGEGVVGGGRIDRAALAAAVFGDGPEKTGARRDLERIVHPRILARMDAELRLARSEPAPPAVVVIDAPLLVGSPLQAECDEIVFVDAPEDARLARTRLGRGWSAEEHRAREQAQGDLDRRRRSATRVIENRGTIADLERAAAALYATWTAAP